MRAEIMKKSSKICSYFICIILILSMFVSCGKNGDNNFINAPDYSNSTKTYTLLAFSSICDDWYECNKKRTYLDSSLLTEENFQQYVDCGFNYLFIDYVWQENSMVFKAKKDEYGNTVLDDDGNTVYENSYNFQNGDLKRILDMAQKKGIKCVVFQPNIQALSNSEESRINPEKAAKVNIYTDSASKLYFDNQEKLNAYVAEALKDLKAHPAFDGVIFIDEPGFKKFDAMKEVYDAVKSACPDANVKQNMLPYADSNEHRMYYFGRQEVATEVAYQEYLEKYYEKIGKDLGYFQYDDYPILQKDKGGVLASFLYCNQTVSNFCKKYGLERKTIYQTCNYSNRRGVKDADIYFQLNVGMAMGNKTFIYYTYYPIISTAQNSLNEDDYIVNRQGKPNPKYYTIQNFHKEMQYNAKALMNFDYVGMQYHYVSPLPNGMTYLNGLVNDDFSILKDVKTEFRIQEGGAVLVTELYDAEKQQFGYYIVNITDPGFTSEAVVELDFGSKQYAQIYQFSTTTNIKTNNGKIKITLGSGGGAFVMPF